MYINVYTLIHMYVCMYLHVFAWMNPHLHRYTPATPTWGTCGGPCCRRDDRRAHADSQPRAEPEQRQPFVDRTANAKPHRHGLDSSNSL